MTPSGPLPTPPAGEVWHALLWALEHDLPALLAHRRLAHRGGEWRRRADAVLVARWLRSTALPGAGR